MGISIQSILKLFRMSKNCELFCVWKGFHMSKSFKSKTWLIKLEKDNKMPITICTDGYIYDEKRRNLFVLKKSSMESINELIDEYKIFSKDEDLDSRYSVKCNSNLIFESNNKIFFNKLVDILFDPMSIKHPDPRLGPILEEINELSESGELKDMINEYGEDLVTDFLIYEHTDSGAVEE